jgi:hypothetical protein
LAQRRGVFLIEAYLFSLTVQPMNGPPFDQVNHISQKSTLN